MSKGTKVPAVEKEAKLLRALEVLKKLDVIEEYEGIKPSSTAAKIIKMVRNNLQ